MWEDTLQILFHPETSCWVSSESMVQKGVMEMPVSACQGLGRLPWLVCGGKILFPTKIWWKKLHHLALEWDVPGEAQRWNQPQTDAGGAVRQSSSCCPHHKANLPVDTTLHNTDRLKRVLFVHYAFWPVAEINRRTRCIHIVGKKNQDKMSKSEFQSGRPTSLSSQPALPMLYHLLNPV